MYGFCFSLDQAQFVSQLVANDLWVELGYCCLSAVSLNPTPL